MDTLLMNSRDHSDVLKRPAVPDMNRGLDGRKLTCGYQVAIQIANGYRDNLLSMLSVESLLIQIEVE
jgi:hypothetical protein